MRGLAITMGLLLLLAACEAASPTPKASQTQAQGSVEGSPVGESREVHLVQVNALTGPSAPFGLRAVHGVEVAASRINDQGGFEDDCGNTYTFRLDQFDMANDAEQALAGLRQAADDPTVLSVIGSTPSSGFLSMIPASGQFSMPVISPGSAAFVSPDDWTPYAFRVTVTVQAAAPVYLGILEDQFDLKRVAVIYDVANDAGRSEAEIVRDSAGEIGYEIVAFEAMNTGDTDVRPQLTTIAAANPDWVGVYGATPEQALAINQMAETGLLDNVQVFSQTGTLNDPVIWDLTDGAVNGAINWTVDIDLTSTDPDIQDFVDRYANAYPDEDPTVYSVYGHQAVEAVVDAVTRACSSTDRNAFRDALGATDIQALGGRVSFDSPAGSPNGENRSGAILVNRVTGRDQGEFEVIARGD